jgi:hypothetical protein
MIRVLLCFGHSLLMVLFNIIYLNSNWIAPVEEELVMVFTKFETFFLNTNKHTQDIIDNTLFINTSHAMSLAEVDNENGQGTIPITDRAKLASFFTFLSAHHNQHKYLLCDIRFTEKSKDDSLLQHTILGLQNFIFPSHIDKRADSLFGSVIDVKQRGVADYVTYEALFSKIMLYYRTNGESLPLKMYEETDLGKKNVNRYHNGFWGLKRDGSWMPKSLFPRFFLVPNTVRNKAVDLNTVLKMIELDSTDFYRSMIKNKIIVMGDFENDVQPTAVGKVPGTLVLYNSYLTLHDNNNRHFIWYIIFLVICFFIISYYFFYFKNLHEKFISRKYHRFVRIFFAHRRLFLPLLAVSILSPFFGSRCSVLWFLLYFLLLEIAELELAKKIFKPIKKPVT